jgi:AcrR family transcriptional regulator
MEDKVDRRVQRTRQLLSEAMQALILEQGYEATTVLEITERANLGRATFYLHYKDKEDLLLSSLEGVFDDLVRCLEASSSKNWRLIGQGAIDLAFEHAAEHADLYRIIFSGHGAWSISKRIRDYIASYTHKVIEKAQAEAGIVPRLPPEVPANYIAASLLGMIAWWLERDMPIPAEEMAETFRLLNFQGTAQFLGIEAPGEQLLLQEDQAN